MPSVCTCELARRADAAAIADISRWLIETDLVPMWSRERILRYIHDKESTVLVARDRAQLVGFAIMQFGDVSAHLNLLGVLPSRQRSGIGRQLLTWLETTAIVAGIFTIRLEVRESNVGARRFYAAMGYSETDVVPGYYQGRDNAVRMVRDLSVHGRDGF
jgi:ribosomal protein S18 acetylase RimI-like enzyme